MPNAVFSVPSTTTTAKNDIEAKTNPASELIEVFAHPSIKGIVSTIGGDDSIRILPFLHLAGLLGDNRCRTLSYMVHDVRPTVDRHCGLLEVLRYFRLSQLWHCFSLGTDISWIWHNSFWQ